MLAGKKQAKIRGNCPESGLVWGINILTIVKNYGTIGICQQGEYKEVVQEGKALVVR